MNKTSYLRRGIRKTYQNHYIIDEGIEVLDLHRFIRQDLPDARIRRLTRCTVSFHAVHARRKPRTCQIEENTISICKHPEDLLDPLYHPYQTCKKKLEKVRSDRIPRKTYQIHPIVYKEVENSRS